MNENHRITVALLAPHETSQRVLNQLACRLAEFLGGCSELGGAVAVLPLAGNYHIEHTDPQRDGAGQSDEEPESDDEPGLPPESPADDVLLRLAKRGVPITYKLIGGKKVASFYAALTEEQEHFITQFVDQWSRPLRVLVIGGYSGEVVAAVRAGALVGSTIYSFQPQFDVDCPSVLNGDLADIHRQLGARVVQEIPLEPADLDAIVIGQGISSGSVDHFARAFAKHLLPEGRMIGVLGAEVMEPLGALVHNDTKIWAISGRKLTSALTAEKEPAGA